MAWSTPYTATAGTILTAATWNVYVRDDLSYLKGLLDGTGGAVTVRVPSTLELVGDANFNLNIGGGNPILQFDSGPDSFAYIRASNFFQWIVAGGLKMQLDSAGKLTGAGFYDSGELSLAASASSSPSHGLGAKPRFVWGYLSTVSGEVAGTAATAILTGTGTATIFISTVSSTTIVVQNTAGATRYARVLAML